ncbi:MAG TPA: hydroxymethylbilane synthase [Novosphingobium sp.]|nr:hydroxymethylbilane synthase [Novosphingobium sp.]
MTQSTPAPARPLRLGTRASPLAMAQAHEARATLCAAHGWDESAVEIVAVTAMGDKVLDRPLAEIGGKALWTKELDAWLMTGEIDFAVHSAKDVETIRPEGIAIAAILRREDVRDCLVVGPGIAGSSIAALPAGARIGTSAPRRAAQMLHLRPDLRIVTFRGNVATRLGKLAAGEAEATLLAMAGLNRLGQDLAQIGGTALDSREWMPAAGQGAIAIEARAGDAQTLALLAAIDHAPSRHAVLAERALLAALGGNCHSALAASTQVEGDRLTLSAALFSPDGAERVEGAISFEADDSLAPARLAADLLARAGTATRAHFTGLAAE